MRSETVPLPGGPRPPSRVVIDRVLPEVDGGRFAAKRVVGKPLVVEADILCDGHEELDCLLRARPVAATTGGWIEVPMACVGNDRWRAAVALDRIGAWEFDVVARIDAFGTWLRDLERRVAAGEPVDAERESGRALVAAAARAATGRARRDLEGELSRFDAADWPDAVGALAGPVAAALRAAPPDDAATVRLPAPRPVWVDRKRAASGAWYEVFPRSWSGAPGRHGTLADLAARLPYVRAMGFDVLYLTPIHPIGRSHRKGRNNAVAAAPGDVGSPWAIGAEEGGHTAIHPELGDFSDFARLRHAAAGEGLELALDLALQCAPDHPWVREHPEWFRRRPDGSIRYAENPPKKYQDIVPFDFACEAWRELWGAIRDVVLFWVGHGVKIFRVDNPHTKPFAFWEWLIAAVHAEHPDVLFLSEAFTRPKTMFRLAKLGFTWSYTYFTWRTEKEETGRYLEEVTTPPLADFFRPAFWPNTPDILHASLQEGGRPMFQARLALAALSVGTWGIYGPAMELLEATPREPGSEEYLDSEKYELRHRDLDDPDSLAPFIARLNRLRRGEPALSADAPAVLCPVDDPHLLAWTRHDAESGNVVLVVVNLAPGTARGAALELDRAAAGLAPEGEIVATLLLGDGTACRFTAGVPTRVACGPDSPALAFRLSVVPPAAPAPGGVR